jgi:catechol 2,3-dioxygenase-like lactoylglutathione lyase family enzyme
MFSGGNVTIHVSNMDRAVHFYTEVLGLKLVYRFGDHWASVQVGNTLTIGLHPGTAQPAGGVHAGSMSIGLELAGSMEGAVLTLEAQGVKFDSVPGEGRPAN